ncbi:TPA: threonylcarbamoyl-AMP synthase [Candidatus Woesearchaeota archaeon]|nr:threonylcarbamoyl-AMP synthase [Candidatus Woesearchaeota archaeon]
MEVITKEEFLLEKVRYLKLISQGSVFIHPTDTIYGIGCDATNEAAVRRVRDAKQRNSMPFSVIAPSKRWVYDNCEVSAEGEKWLDRLPGPYTLILRLKKASAIASSVNLGSGTLGIRIPRHWISDLVKELGFPVLSTSANLTGRQYMTAIDDLDESIRQKVDFMVYEGEKEGRPSTIVKLFEKEVELVER